MAGVTMPPNAAIGQRRRPGVAQLAQDELALDLEGGQVEEERHQDVVDDVPQVEADLEVGAHRELEGARPQPFVGAVPRRVRPQHGDDGGGEHHQGPGRLLLHQTLQRLDDTAGHEPIGLSPAQRRPALRHVPARNWAHHRPRDRAARDELTGSGVERRRTTRCCDVCPRCLVRS
jgi:hypothetical protein